MDRVFKDKPKLVTIKHWMIGYVVTVAIGALVVAILFRGQYYAADQVAVVIAIPMIIAVILGRNVWSRMFQGSSQNTGKEQTKLSPFAFAFGLCALLALLSLFLCFTFATSSGIYLLLGLNWAFVTIWPGFILLLLKVAGGLAAVLAIMVVLRLIWTYRSQLLPFIRKVHKAFKKAFKASGVSSDGIQFNGFRLRLRP